MNASLIAWTQHPGCGMLAASQWLRGLGYGEERGGSPERCRSGRWRSSWPWARSRSGPVAATTMMKRAKSRSPSSAAACRPLAILGLTSGASRSRTTQGLFTRRVSRHRRGDGPERVGRGDRRCRLSERGRKRLQGQGPERAHSRDSVRFGRGSSRGTRPPSRRGSEVTLCRGLHRDATRVRAERRPGFSRRSSRADSGRLAPRAVRGRGPSRRVRNWPAPIRGPGGRSAQPDLQCGLRRADADCPRIGVRMSTGSLRSVRAW